MTRKPATRVRGALAMYCCWAYFTSAVGMPSLKLNVAADHEGQEIMHFQGRSLAIPDHALSVESLLDTHPACPKPVVANIQN
ncbi:hypothetical protein [Massilia genomosp. 1]|uniref:hypothetical protein n=1 Tax=Massilia genomosp. 1 TaxID=2609280 RepID=UPI00141F633A|nr:hypothetical protein [Massilia genomosp. 1]